MYQPLAYLLKLALHKKPVIQHQLLRYVRREELLETRNTVDDVDTLKGIKGVRADAIRAYYASAQPAEE